MDISLWQYDEMTQLGRDFADRKVVETYDAYHRQFRDIDKENEETIKCLGLESHHVVADFGCGTGNFVIQAAQKCAKVMEGLLTRAGFGVDEKNYVDGVLARYICTKIAS